MIKDYAKKKHHYEAKPRARYASDIGYRSSTQSGFPAWMLIASGLFVGIVVSGMIYWKLKPAHSVATPVTTEQVVAANKTAPKKPANAEQENASNRFDFYTVLPSGTEAPQEVKQVAQSTLPKEIDLPVQPKIKAKELPQETLDVALSAPTDDDIPPPGMMAAKANTVTSTATAPVTTVAVNAPQPKAKADATSQQYIVQVGSFTRLAPAEGLKAQLTLSGFETHIQTIRMGPRDARYRVYIGPFDNKEKAQFKQRQIEQANQLHSLVVKFRV
jgi:cell division protein FtsN